MILEGKKKGSERVERKIKLKSWNTEQVDIYKYLRSCVSDDMLYRYPLHLLLQ